MNNVPFPFTSYHSRRQRVHNRQLQRNYLSSISLIHNHFKWTTEKPCPPPGDRMTTTTSPSSSFLHRFPVSRFLSLHLFRNMANALRTNSSLEVETNSDLPHVELKPLLHQEGDVNENDGTVSGQFMKWEKKKDSCGTETGIKAVNFCRCSPKMRNKDGEVMQNIKTTEWTISFRDELFFEGGPLNNSTLSSGPWLVVPSELGFTDSGAQCFVGKVALRNISPGYISFMVMPTAPNFFSLFPREAILPPGHGLDVIITTKRNLDKNPPSVEVLLRSGFYVLATPIYFSSQLSQKKVKLLWKAYGSPLFPPESAECHLIKRLIPFGGDEEKGGVLGDYNIMEQAAMGNYTARVKELPDLKTMLKRRQRRMELRGEKVMKESDYVKSWMPSEVGPEQERFLKAHFRELTKSVTRVREDMDAASTITRLTGFTLLAFGFAFFILRYLTFVQSFGANGVLVKDARNNYAK